MSLYFNWSCDFQRFTKSKKLSKFQVRTTTSFNLNKVLSTSLFNLQGTICCFKKLSFSFAACLLYQMKFRLSRTFSKLFSKFLKYFSQNSNFSDRHLFRNSLFSISNSKPFVKNFFHSFQIFFSSTAVPLGDSSNRIPQGLPSCQQLFSFFCNLLQLRKKAPLLEPFYYCANRLYIRSMVTMACSPV